MYRIFYKRAFNKQSDALKELKEVVGIAANPKIVQSKSGAWFVVLYEHTDMQRIISGRDYYRQHGLVTYMQEVKE